MMDRYASMIPETNLVFGTSQLQGAKNSAVESETLKLVFKNDGDSVTDVKNSTLNFRFIAPATPNAMLSVNNSTMASLF